MKLTNRGKRVRALSLTLLVALLLWGISEVAMNLWLTPSGYCWGSAFKCLVGGL